MVRAEFSDPAVRVRTGPAHSSASWRAVPWRRKVWLRSRKPGDQVEVLDDFGNVWSTTVRAIEPSKRDGRSLEPRIWLHGHPSSYAAARVHRPGGRP
jgi:hypothetical protein